MCKLARVEGLDLSGVKVVGGDFHQQQLQTELNKESHLHRLCMITAEEMQGPTVLFTSSVFSMHGCTKYLRDNYGISAVPVWGKQEPEERNENLRAFRSGEAKVLVNCQVVAVGFDFPPLTTLILGRPTRSRVFWLQVAGRAIRPLPGVVDYPGSTPEGRRERIAASAKPHFRLIDCTPGSLDQSLITSVDMFCKADEEVKEAVKKAASQKPLTQEEMTELAAKEAAKIASAKAIEAAKIASAKAIEALRNSTQGRGDGRVTTEDVKLTGKRAAGTYRNPIRGKYAGARMCDIPGDYLAWGAQNLKGWPRALYQKERDRRREKQRA